MANLVTVKKRKNFDHVIGKETEQEYDLSNDYIAKLAQDRICEIFHGGIGLSDAEEFSNANALNLVEGDYEMDTGDFTYYITIK